MPDFEKFMKGFKLPEGTKQEFFNVASEIKDIGVNFSGQIGSAVTDLAQSFGEMFADLNNGLGEIEPFGNRIKKLKCLAIVDNNIDRLCFKVICRSHIFITSTRSATSTV